MVLQDALVNRINKYIEKLKKQRDLSHIYFKVSASKTSTSIYIQMYSFVDDEKIRVSFRLADHYKSRIKTKILKKHTKFHLIEREIDSMIARINKKRFQIKLNNINKKK